MTDFKETIPTALLYAAIVIFVIDVAFASVLVALVLRGYLSFLAISYLFYDGAYLFLVVDVLIILSFILRKH